MDAHRIWVFSVLVPVEVSYYQPLDDNNRETNTSKARMGGIFRTYEYVPRIHSMYICVCTEFRRIADTRPRRRLELLYGAYGKKAGKVILRDVIGQIKGFAGIFFIFSPSRLLCTEGKNEKMSLCTLLCTASNAPMGTI